MDLRVLRSFLVAAEEEHFGRAAARVHLSQPALSRQISRLEEAVGTRLFSREGQGVVLTRAGEVFVPYARRCLREYERGASAAARAVQGLGGTLDVGFVTPALYANIVPRLLSRFRERAPQVEVTLHELSSVPQAAALRSEALDVGFLHPPVPGGGLELHVLLRQRFVAALPAAHPLAAVGALHAAQLAGEPFIIFSRARGAGLYDRIITACQLAGLSPRITQEANTMQTIISLVAAGLGVAILPHAVTHLAQSDVAYRELVDIHEEGVLAAAWLATNASPVLQTFLEVVRQPPAADAAPEAG